MGLKHIEPKIREAVSNITVAEDSDIPFSNYEEFLESEKAGEIQISSAYNGDLVYELGDKGEVIMHTILVFSPLAFAISSMGFAFFLSNFWLLFGILLAGLGFFLSTPAFMKGFGSLILLGTFIFLGYALYDGNHENAILAGSYALSNFLVYVAREQCRMIIHRTILKSEPIFVWLYKNGEILVKSNQ